MPKRRPSSASAAPSGFDFTAISLLPPDSRLRVKSARDQIPDAFEDQADRAAQQAAYTHDSYPRRGAGSGLDRHASIVRTQDEPAAEAKPGIPAPVGNALRSPGQALDPDIRELMERRLGHDFSHVRVHTDAESAASADSMNARAYTVGRHIAFASGEYAPQTSEGRWLLAHELTHVIQQSGNRARVQRAPKSGKPAKGGASVTGSLRALHLRSAEVQRKLQEFSGLKDWRKEFHASNEEKLRRIHELFSEWREAQTEWEEIRDEWYLFEHESSPWIEKRLDHLFREISWAYWAVKGPDDAERTYELQSRRTEAGLLKEQAGLIAEIGRLGKAGTASQAQIDALLTRLERLSDSIDRMWDEEIRAQVKYTGAGPVSRAP